METKSKGSEEMPVCAGMKDKESSLASFWLASPEHRLVTCLGYDKIKMDETDLDYLLKMTRMVDQVERTNAYTLALGRKKCYTRLAKFKFDVDKAVASLLQDEQNLNAKSTRRQASNTNTSASAGFLSPRKNNGEQILEGASNFMSPTKPAEFSPPGLKLDVKSNDPMLTSTPVEKELPSDMTDRSAFTTALDDLNTSNEVNNTVIQVDMQDDNGDLEKLPFENLGLDGANSSSETILDSSEFTTPQGKHQENVSNSVTYFTPNFSYDDKNPQDIFDRKNCSQPIGDQGMLPKTAKPKKGKSSPVTSDREICESDEKSMEMTPNQKEKRKRRPTHVVPSPRKFVVHGQPREIEEILPLALTYGTEPKIATFQKISDYIAKYYPSSNLNELQAALDEGVKNGRWWQEPDAPGIYRLQVAKINPSSDDDYPGQICNAILASTKPKSARFQVLKNYIVDFHSDITGVSSRNVAPVKKAFERAMATNLIRSIGGKARSMTTMTFELVPDFIPAPIILQGDDVEADYEEMEDSQKLPWIPVVV